MFKITLDDPQAAYLPGQQIGGRVNWTDVQADSDRIEVRLIWHTAGKGDQDVEIVDSVETVQPKTNGELRFNFVAPQRPYSFSGRLITLTWAIEALVFPSREAEQAELMISSDGREVILHP